LGKKTDGAVGVLKIDVIEGSALAHSKRSILNWTAVKKKRHSATKNATSSYEFRERVPGIYEKPNHEKQRIRDLTKSEGVKEL